VRSRLPMRALLPGLAALVGAAARAQEPAPEAAAAPAPPAQTGAIPDDELAVLFEGAFLGAENGQDFRETPGLRKILEQLSRIPPEELARRSEGDFDYEAAMGDPRSFQGRFFRRYGILVHVEAVRLRTPIFDQEDLYRAFVVDTDGARERDEFGNKTGVNEGFVVDMLELPPTLELRRAVVDVEGIFYRTVRYENRDGKFVEAPYLIARRIVPVDTDDAPRKSSLPNKFLPMIVVGAAVAYGLYRGAMIWSEHRRKLGRAPAEGARARGRGDRPGSMAQSRDPEERV
jgi:hypothetical protein